MNVLHLFTYNSYGNGGFSQRINRQIEIFYNLKDINFKSLHFTSIKNKFDKEFQRRVKNHKKMYIKNNYNDLKIQYMLPRRFFKYYINIYYKMILKYLIRYIKKNNIDLIYAENLMPGYLAYLVYEKYGVNYILDYHGVVPEERKYFSSKSLKGDFNYNFLKQIEKKTVENSKNINVVSKAFKEYIIKNFDIKKELINVVPSSIEKKYIKFDSNIRKKYRQKLGIDNKKVFIYTGSYTKYQCTEEMIEFFSYINKKEKNTFFIFLVTGDLKMVKNIFKKYNIDSSSYYVNSVEHSEVIKYHMASDYGVIFREDNIVNEVASPTKIYEYLSTGLKIIGTNNIGDIKDIPTDKYLFNYKQLNNYHNYSLDEILSLEDREINFYNCKNYLLENYVWEKYEPIYKEIFK